MLTRKLKAFKIEYHWHCIKLLKKKLRNAKKTKKQQLIGKISYHKHKAQELSYQYEILIGLRDKNGVFIT